MFLTKFINWFYYIK